MMELHLGATTPPRAALEASSAWNALLSLARTATLQAVQSEINVEAARWSSASRREVPEEEDRGVCCHLCAKG